MHSLGHLATQQFQPCARLKRLVLGDTGKGLHVLHPWRASPVQRSATIAQPVPGPSTIQRGPKFFRL